MPMRVGELARRSGVGVSTLRAWERRFHFLEPQRTPAGHRLYDDDDVERVAAVVRLVSEGLTLPSAIARVSSLGTGALPGGEAEEFFFGQILQVASQGVWVWRHGRTRYVNQKMAELMACSVDELLAQPAPDFAREDASMPGDAARRRRRADQHRTFTQELRRCDGTTFLAQGTTAPLYNHAGQYEGSVAMVDDVTERAEAEAQWRYRNALLDAIGDAVLAARPDGTIVYANAAAERLLGWRAAELMGQNGLELLQPKDAPPGGMEFHNGLVARQPQSGELPIARKDGTQVMAHVTGAPVLNDRRELVGLIAVLVDNSDRHRVEHQIQVQDQQADVLATLGAEALRTRSGGGEKVLRDVVGAVRRALGCEYSRLVDVDAAGTRVLMESPDESDADDHERVPLSGRSVSAYAARAGKVVIVDDAVRDRRFDFASRPPQRGIRSVIAAPIFSTAGVGAVLMACSTEVSRFDMSSAHFMQSMANVAGIALLGVPQSV